VDGVREVLASGGQIAPKGAWPGFGRRFGNFGTRSTSVEWVNLETLNLVRGWSMSHTSLPTTNQRRRGPGHVTDVEIVGTPSLSLERLKIET